MDSIRLRANAKVNYSLDVLGKRRDGYHEIRTVLQSISLHDEVEIERSDSGFSLIVEPGGVEIGPQKQSTVYRAWTALRDLKGIDLPVRVRLRKEVPSGAGLGGGSADAAAFLVGMNELYGLGLGWRELSGVGAGIGADVPFCIVGGTRLGERIGEELSPLPAPPPHYLLVAKPEEEASTARIYTSYDSEPRRSLGSTEAVIPALKDGDLGALARSLGNDLGGVTRRIVPQVSEYEAGILGSSAIGATMSGTGSAVFGVFATEAEARDAFEGFGAPFCGVYEPVARGVEVIEAR